MILLFRPPNANLAMGYPLVIPFITLHEWAKWWAYVWYNLDTSKVVLLVLFVTCHVQKPFFMLILLRRTSLWPPCMVYISIQMLYMLQISIWASEGSFHVLHSCLFWIPSYSFWSLRIASLSLLLLLLTANIEGMYVTSLYNISYCINCE